MPNIKIGDDEYEYIPSPAVAASKVIADFYEKLGRPKDPFTKSGEKMMKIIISVYEDLYPEESAIRKQQIKQYQQAEMPNDEKVKKKTGRNLASVPTPIYKIMKQVFPDFKMDNRDDFMKLTKKYRYFQVTKDR